MSPTLLFTSVLTSQLFAQVFRSSFPSHYLLSLFIKCISSTAHLKPNSSSALFHLQTNFSYPASLTAGLFVDFLPISLAPSIKAIFKPHPFPFHGLSYFPALLSIPWTTSNVYVHAHRCAHVTDSNILFSLLVFLLSIRSARSSPK